MAGSLLSKNRPLPIAIKMKNYFTQNSCTTFKNIISTKSPLMFTHKSHSALMSSHSWQILLIEIEKKKKQVSKYHSFRRNVPSNSGQMSGTDNITAQLLDM